LDRRPDHFPHHWPHNSSIQDLAAGYRAYECDAPVLPSASCPTKRQPISIVWADDTDTICDLPYLLTYLDNFASNRHKANATLFPVTGRSAHGLLKVRKPHPPFHLPALSHNILSCQQCFCGCTRSYCRNFAGIHSRPVTSSMLTRPGSFAFLGDLFATERLFELRDFRISRAMPKGEAIEQFAASVHLVLDFADKYPRDSLAAHILDVVANSH
jgi:hypothetical protein